MMAVAASVFYNIQNGQVGESCWGKTMETVSEQKW